jgi:hypothetical protein
MLEVNVKIIIIVVIIIILFISGYNKINTDIMTDDDLMNLYIMAQLNTNSTDNIKDYKFMTRTSENIVYENDDTIKFYIRGTNTLYDVYVDLTLYFGTSNIEGTTLYNNSINLLKHYIDNNYKGKKIVIIAHSLGCVIANRINNTLNIDQVKMFCPFYGFEYETYKQENVKIIENYYDILPTITKIRHFIGLDKLTMIFRSLPVTSSDFLFLHMGKYFASIYDNNYIYTIDVVFLSILIYTLIYYAYKV